jgi:prepilin signal peptidase PulO-like enzyme (type II secretory pathway)
VVSIADIKTGAVPRVAFLVAFGCFGALRVLTAESCRPLWESMAGLPLGIAVFVLALVVSGGRLGWADVWYSGLIGMVRGPVWWYPSMGIACAAAILFIGITRKRCIPFIPFMAAGNVTTCFMHGWIQ